MSSRRLEPVAAPILLWACAALVFHYTGYKASTEVADVFEERRDLREFANEARGSVRSQASTPFEVALEGPIPTPQETPPLVPVPPPPNAKLVPPAPDTPKPPEPEKKDEPKPEATQQPPTPPVPTNDKRVAVRQHVDDKNQPDNPNARFAGDEANHVKEESVARITSHDRNDRETSPGTSQGGPKEEPGNAEKTRIADSEDRAGEAKRPPGERQPETPPQTAPKPEPVAKAPSDKPGQNGVSGPRATPQPAAPQPPSQPEPPRPDVDTGPSGSYALNPRRNASEGPVSKAPPTPPINMVPRLGGGPGPNGVNFNLSPGNAVAAVGLDELRRMKDNDGERRRSAHRGSFKSPDLNRWKAQIENYVASVKTGNQTALNTARVPFATYLNGIHNRLHPLFADDYLATLDGLPNGHPLNRPDLNAALEVVVSKEDGSIVRMGVVKTSGVTAFDAAALESMQRASPFGKPPSAIVSPDGNVYLHWEFHRNPIVACSTINARPFMLKGAPADAPGRPLPGPRVPTDPRERPPTREGRVEPPLSPPKPGSG